jgi:hypothetical protein
MERLQDDRAPWLSARAQALLHTITAWVNHFPPGIVNVTHELFPPDDDYGSELLVTLRPKKPHGCALTIGVISDTRVPYHFHLGDRERIAQGTGLPLWWTVPTHVPLFLDSRWEVSQAELKAICQAVADAGVTLELGLIRGTLVAVEGDLWLPSGLQPLHLHGVGGPMRLVRLVRRFGGGDIRPFTWEPWT